MGVVTLDRISKRYDGVGHVAVDEVSLTVDDGEFMVFLGPSGCGKSTTLRMIAGLESISDGQLWIDGRLMNRVAAKDRDIAMVFQSYALYPHMTVRDNLAFGLKRRSVERAEIERRVTEAARVLELTPYLDRKPFALSGGQRQRVALGRAIVRDPTVFLLDEPLSNLDAALRVSTRNELIRQHRRLGTTMIYVTHDQVEAMSMGTRICIMNRGKLVQVGPPIDVYRRPADTFVARFLGSPPMNLMPGTIVPGDGPPTVRIGDTLLRVTTYSPGSLQPGTRVLVGIRPEDVYEPGMVSDRSSGGKPPMGGLPARAVAVEPLGAETLIVCEIDSAPWLEPGPTGGTANGHNPEDPAGTVGTHEFIARGGRDVRVRPGDRLTLQLDLTAIQLFDAATSLAIDPAASHAALFNHGATQ